MRDTCQCGAPLTLLPESPYGEGPTYRCVNGHFSTNPVIDFAHAEPGAPVAFWMPRQDWDALPFYTGAPYDGHALYRDPTRAGVVYRWLGKHWWQATLSFAPSPPARMPYAPGTHD